MYQHVVCHLIKLGADDDDDDHDDVDGDSDDDEVVVVRTPQIMQSCPFGRTWIKFSNAV